MSEKEVKFNPRIKHYIFTRFSNIYACKAIPKDEFLSENRLRKKLEIYKKTSYKSLLSQTNQNFVNLLMVHDDIPDVIYNELLQLTIGHDNIKIIKQSVIGNNYSNNEYIKSILNINEYDFLITSRFDDDDMLYKNAIDDIQNSINENTLIKYFGFKNGCTFDYNTDELYAFNKKSDDGMISIGISMIVNLSVYGILPFNIYWGHHSKMRGEFIEIKLPEINKIYQLTEDYLNGNNFWETKITKFPTWVYVRHDQSKSAFIGRFESKLHYSNIPIEKDIINEKFFKYF